MKILSIGDFHGKFPAKLKKLVKEEKIDLVVSVGDYCPFIYRKIWFKYHYKSDSELWEVIGKKKMKEFIKKDLQKGEEILKQLNKLKVPVISISGNLDYSKWKDGIDYAKSKWDWPSQDFFSNIIKKYKHIKFFDYSFVRFKGLIFIGSSTSTFPGRIQSKNYKKNKARLDKLFKKFKKENKNKKVIFVSHNVPYKTKLSKINSKDSPNEVQGVEKGSKLSRRIIEKYKPILNLCGHMHENQGRDKIKETLIINNGAVVDGRACVIDFDEEKGRVKEVRFIK